MRHSKIQQRGSYKGAWTVCRGVSVRVSACNQSRRKVERDRWVSVRPWRIRTGTSTPAAAAALATYPGNAPSPGLPERSILEGHLHPFDHPSLWPPAAPRFMWITWKLIGVKHKQVPTPSKRPPPPRLTDDDVGGCGLLVYTFYKHKSFCRVLTTPEFILVLAKSFSDTHYPRKNSPRDRERYIRATEDEF